MSLDNTIDNRERGEARLLAFPARQVKSVSFDRRELSTILNLYGRYVALGEWRDYGLDFGNDKATFMVLRRSAEQPLYRITKTPEHARKQALYAVVAQGGLTLKRGNDLNQVLRILEPKTKFEPV